eukprot:g972.t1
MLAVTGRKTTIFYVFFILLTSYTISGNTVLGNRNAGSGLALEPEAYKAGIAMSVLKRPSFNMPCLQKGRVTYGPCDPGLQSKNLEDVHDVIHVASSIRKRFKPYAEEFIKKTMKEARPIEQNYKESKSKHKTEQETKSEQKRKRETVRNQEERGKFYSKKQATEEHKKVKLTKRRRAEYAHKKLKSKAFQAPMVTGKTAWPVCKILPGYFYVQHSSVLVRTTIDVRGVLANGEGISFYEHKGGETLGDFTVTDPRDAVTLTLNDPYEGPTKRLKACKMDNTPVTLEGYVPLQGVVAVLAGSPVIRTSRCLLGNIGIGDTIHIGATQEFTIKNPVTCEALTLDRSWPTNAGLKGDSPVGPNQIRWLYGSGLVKYSTGVDKLSNAKSYNNYQGGGKDANKNSTIGRELIHDGYTQEGSLWLEFDCKNLAKKLCTAAFVESNEMEERGGDKLVIDVYSDNEKCCDTQDVRSCSPGNCRNSLHMIAHIHVEVKGKQVSYRIDDHDTGKTLQRKRLFLVNSVGELVS